MALLENCNVLLIAPQPWNHIHLSKHHYAIELSRRGNTVYFLEPPTPSVPGHIQITTLTDHPGIRVVRYQPRVPLVLRFHARRLYDRLMRREIDRILSAIGNPLDVVWSFEFNLFTNLRAFRAPLTLFHPVDPLSAPHQIGVARSADAVFSVSDQILANFSHLDVPVFFINHGLSQPFADEARKSPGANGSQGRPPRVGYAGNLTRPPLNRPVISQMVSENPSVEFNFWGPFDLAVEPPNSAVDDVTVFIRFLKSCANVRLHGPVSAANLARHIQRMDCLVLSYSVDPKESDRSNSHKILEYLSTGKVIVSSLISTYADQPHLLRMPDDGDDSRLPILLRDTLSRLDEFNRPDLQDERRRFALDNTYARQLERIVVALASVRRNAPSGVRRTLRKGQR